MQSNRPTNKERTMFTVALTLIGIVAFFITAINKDIKSGWIRLCMFSVSGLVLDILTAMVIAAVIASTM